MLYLTTADPFDAYTAHRTLTEDRAPNGGLYLPFKMPKLVVSELREKSFGQCVAETLNTFFSTRLTGWDVEFCVGRYPVKIAGMSHRILTAELWRNLDGSYANMERRLAAKVCPEAEGKVTSWTRIAIRIAVLTGLFSELLRTDAADEAHPIDAAVPAGDFTLPMAVWYAREMGLPIANIVCGTDVSSGVWDLLHLGEMRTGGADPAVSELERLVCGTLGVRECIRFRGIRDRGGVYSLLPADAEKLRRGMFAAVVSRDRLEKGISSVYRTNAYILDPDASLSYGALMDYRAKTGENRTALLLADIHPMEDAKRISAAMNLSEEELKRILENG